MFRSLDADLTRSDGTMIDGWLFRPVGVGPFAAVVALHGCAGLYRRDGELSARHRVWAERLAARSYVVLFPDSFFARGVDEICSRNLQPIRPAFERNRDTYGALQYLQAQPFIRSNQIALLGWSHGAMTALATIAAKTHARPVNLRDDFRVAVAFYPGCKAILGRNDWLPPVAPVHMFMGDRDDWTVPGPCVQLAERAKTVGASVDITLYPGAFHDFDDPSTPVHKRGHVATTASGTATIGTDPVARADAINQVMLLLHEQLDP